MGAATVRALVERGVEEIAVMSRSGRSDLFPLWLDESQQQKVRLIEGDVCSRGDTGRTVRDLAPTHIIHLAGFQSPQCDAHPEAGMKANVGGTMNILAAAENLGTGLKRMTVASSGAVYGSRSLYPGRTVKETDPLLPPNLYGTWKLASEHLARLFQDKTGVPTVCLRFSTTYGKGRDQGRTAAPTTAMKAIALSNQRKEVIPFRIPYRGREQYHYVGDVGNHFAACTLSPFTGYGAFNIPGETCEVSDFVAMVTAAADDAGLSEYTDIGIADDALVSVFVCDLDPDFFRAVFPGVPVMSLREGVRLALEEFRDMAEQGTLKELPGG